MTGHTYGSGGSGLSALLLQLMTTTQKRATAGDVQALLQAMAAPASTAVRLCDCATALVVLRPSGVRPQWPGAVSGN